MLMRKVLEKVIRILKSLYSYGVFKVRQRKNIKEKKNAQKYIYPMW